MEPALEINTSKAERCNYYNYAFIDVRKKKTSTAYENIAPEEW